MRTLRILAQVMLVLGALAVLSPAGAQTRSGEVRMSHEQGLLPKRITATGVSIWKPGS